MVNRPVTLGAPSGPDSLLSSQSTPYRTLTRSCGMRTGIITAPAVRSERALTASDPHASLRPRDGIDGPVARIPAHQQPE